MSNCIFCKIVRKEAPATVEFEDNDIIAFKNINPVAEVHILITPKEHIETFMDIDSDIILKMSKAAQSIVRDKKIEKGFKLIINGGKYQAVPHLHWHLLAGKLEDTDDVLNKT